MTGSDRRMENVYKGLTFKERVLLALRSFKEDDEAPAAFRRTIPFGQGAEIDEELGFADAVQHEVTWFAIWLQSRLEGISVRLGMVSCLQLWELHADQVRMHLLCDAGEPVTQSEYDARLGVARAEAIPVDALAEMLAEEDLETEDLAEAQYERRLGDHERELRRLVGEGLLPGAGRGRKLTIPAGAFYDWRGTEVPVVPEWGLLLEVFPDEAAEQVHRLRAQRETIRDLLARAPSVALGEEIRERSGVEALGREIVLSAAGELSAAWSELLGVERVVQEASERFEGEEPIHPETRRLLEEIRAMVIGLLECLQRWCEDVALPEEPDEQVVASLTRIVEQEARSR